MTGVVLIMILLIVTKTQFVKFTSEFIINKNRFLLNMTICVLNPKDQSSKSN